MNGDIGKQVGHYKLLRQVGRGGFSNVYLGEHIHLGTQVAVKILKRPLVHRWRWQFRREARIAASLRHPHISPVLDFGIWKGAPYLVMPLASGGSLREVYRNGTAPGFETMLLYLEQIASALEYLHSRGLLHLDLKPENLLLADDGTVLLSDFGIAEMSRQQYTLGIGTPAYMAPEQIQGHASNATDQYALAIIVYEWLAGRKPFGGTREEILDQQLHTRPYSICERAGDVTPAMERVVFRALSKDPARRYPSVRAFVRALSRATFPGNYAPSVTGEHTTVMTPGETLTTQQYLLKIETWEEGSHQIIASIYIAAVFGVLAYLISKSTDAAFYTFGLLMPLLPLLSLLRKRNLLAQGVAIGAFAISVPLSYMLQSVAALPFTEVCILTTGIAIAYARKYISLLSANPHIVRNFRRWFHRLTRFIL